MSALVDIVVVNWNAGQQLADCVKSVGEFGGTAVGKLVVVDNGSTDRSLDAIANEAVDIVRAGENLGFGKACNLGAGRCHSPYILFLNPDACLMADTLTIALDFMASAAAAKVGICGVRLLGDNGQTQRHSAHFPVWQTYLGRALGLEGRIPALFPPLHMREFDHLSSRAVDHVIGAFYLVRRSLFDSLGGFDERFFVYLEDLDFSLRARQAGWMTWYLAEAVAYHKGGGVSEQVKAHRLFYSIRSRMLYALKHFSMPAAAAVIVMAVALEPVLRLARAALHRSKQEIVDTIRGYGMIWRCLPSLFRHSSRTFADG